jgi:peptidoglycan-N-acetylglucosamine deacetylase
MLRFVAFFVFSLSFLSHAQAIPPKIQVAITVDDLPAHSPLPTGRTRIDVARKMLSTLSKYQVPGVVGFINAQKIEEEPGSAEVLKQWTKAGYPLGNHHYSHADLHKMSGDEFVVGIVRNEKALETYSNGKDWKYFRYPFLREGDTLEKRKMVRNFLIQKEYKIAPVTIDLEDWAWNAPYARCKDRNQTASIQWLRETYLQNAKDQLDRAVKLSGFLFKRPIPHILLLHIGAFDAEMLESLIQEYLKKGVEFVPLKTALADPVYRENPDYVATYGCELTFQILKTKGLILADAGMTAYDGYPEKKLEEICR